MNMHIILFQSLKYQNMDMATKNLLNKTSEWGKNNNNNKPEGFFVVVLFNNNYKNNI